MSSVLLKASRLRADGEGRRGLCPPFWERINVPVSRQHFLYFFPLAARTGMVAADLRGVLRRRRLEQRPVPRMASESAARSEKDKADFIRPL
jgi:hypothetical protein